MQKEHPIIFRADMVRAIIDNRKTVTRRVIKNITQEQDGLYGTEGMVDCVKDWDGGPSRLDMMNTGTECCPYCQKGDLLWVKETYCHGDEWDDCKPSEVDPLCGGNNIWYLACGDKPIEGWGKTRSARFMPKWVSRLWLEVWAVWAERIREITLEDIRQEGLIFKPDCDGSIMRTEMKKLWDSLNAKRGYGWDTNPWVWRIEFNIAKI